jgi:hypothetical protein
MIKKYIFFILIVLTYSTLFAQNKKEHNFSVGAIIEKTHYLYFENGIGANYSSENLFHNKLQLKTSYLTSRIGSALNSNALKHDYLIVGADWKFRITDNLDLPLGLNTGLYSVDYENEVFRNLPNKSVLFSIETGLKYDFNFPITVSLNIGYHLISGDGVSVPGSLFPLYYKLGLFYRL